MRSVISCCRLGGVVASRSLPAQRVPAGWCSGFTLASCAEGSGFYPRLMQVVLRIGTASAGDTHSLARRTNPPTAGIVPRYRVAWG